MEGKIFSIVSGIVRNIGVCRRNVGKFEFLGFVVKGDGAFLPCVVYFFELMDGEGIEKFVRDENGGAVGGYSF